ncbi:unnamed protein product [Sphagnum balticum]
MEGDSVSRAEFTQLQTQLTQTIALAEENNRLLRNMRKWGRIAFWFKIQKLFAWLQKNERHVSTVVFIGGTTADILTLHGVTIAYAIHLLGIYTIVALIATIAEHYLFIHEATEGPFLRGLRVFLAFVAEFMIGCQLSGCLIFYSRSAALTASWPFILLLLVVFFGNEFMRNYRERLAFRCTLLFFTIYAYTVFTLPTLLHHIGPDSFLESTAVTLGVFIVFFLALAITGWKRLKASFLEIVGGVAVVLVLVNVSYFTGIIPPLPLALRDVGVYHSIVHVVDTTGDTAYQVQAEASNDPWWDFGHFIPETVHITPGEPLSVFSAVFAPTAFSSAIVHRWQEYDPQKHTWVTKAVIAFSISGGRDSGYRGYSTLSNLSAGKYRVSIDTLSGQVIGQIYFNVLIVPADPVLHTESH